MLRPGKSVFVVGLAAQFCSILQFAFLIVFIGHFLDVHKQSFRTFSKIHLSEHREQFGNHSLGDLRRDENKGGKGASAMGCSPHIGSYIFIDSF
jgi:hypothetical protein